MKKYTIGLIIMLLALLSLIGCGNPANDSDLCEGYTYDDETRTITLKYPKPNESIVTTIRIKDYDENSIELDFEGDIRKFTKEN